MTRAKETSRAHPSLPLRPCLFALCLALAGCGGTPALDPSLPGVSGNGHDWRKHYDYGLKLLSAEGVPANNDMFARAAFASAARFSGDHSPSFVGLGVAEMRNGNFAAAEVAFLNAALIDDRSMYWAFGGIAALRNGDEIVARAFFDGMQAARQQDGDPASAFLRGIYAVQGWPGAVERIPYSTRTRGVTEDLSCDDESEDAICRNLNIVTNVFFVRRYSSDALVRGTDFFKDLTFQLGAETTAEWQREEGNISRTLTSQATLSIPEIQYALRLTPEAARSSVQVSAAPSVITSIGNESEIREGANVTILYNSSGDAENFTAETGMTLHLTPEMATPDFVKLGLSFEYSTITEVSPSATAQVLGVATNSYSVTGTFPYGTPVVLGTITGGTQEFSSSGQKGLDRMPLLGGMFGASDSRITSSDTIVLGVLSEPEAFRGSRQRQMLEAMRAEGVRIASPGEIRRRRTLHQAPDVAALGLDLLRGTEAAPQ